MLLLNNTYVGSHPDLFPDYFAPPSRSGENVRPTPLTLAMMTYPNSEARRSTTSEPGLWNIYICSSKYSSVGIFRSSDISTQIRLKIPAVRSLQCASLTDFTQSNSTQLQSINSLVSHSFAISYFFLLHNAPCQNRPHPRRPQPRANQVTRRHCATMPD